MDYSRFLFLSPLRFSFEIRSRLQFGIRSRSQFQICLRFGIGFSFQIQSWFQTQPPLLIQMQPHLSFLCQVLFHKEALSFLLPLIHCQIALVSLSQFVLPIVPLLKMLTLIGIEALVQSSLSHRFSLHKAETLSVPSIYLTELFCTCYHPFPYLIKLPLS